MSAKHRGVRSPTQSEMTLGDVGDPAKTIADLRAQLGEREAWLTKIKVALGVKSNAHALALAKSYGGERRKRTAEKTRYHADGKEVLAGEHEADVGVVATCADAESARLIADLLNAQGGAR